MLAYFSVHGVSRYTSDIPQIFIYLYVYLHFERDLLPKTLILELKVNKIYQQLIFNEKISHNYL